MREVNKQGWADWSEPSFAEIAAQYLVKSNKVCENSLY